jgi:glycosyltransferase involved in cell wall biosynthesis
MATPRISTIIPYFNAHDTIKASLHSILDSTAEIDEIVIVNDGSSSESGEMLEETLKQVNDSRIKRFDHKHNLGGGAARNTAIMRSTNDWIFCLDSDNLVPPSLLAELSMSVELSAPKFQVFVPEKIAFFDNASSLVTHLWHMDVNNLSVDDFLKTAVVPAASGNYLFSRESWEKSGGYPTKSGALDTWGFGLRQFVAGYAPLAVTGATYFHRVGTNSYYNRDSARMKEMSLRATALVLELASDFSSEQLRFVLGNGRARRWFATLKAPKVKNLQKLPAVGFSLDRRQMTSDYRDSLEASLHDLLHRSGVSY